MTKPILYKAFSSSRFSDLDPYGHVNFKHYFDFVVESRLSFLDSHFGLSLAKLAKKGIGFYATRGEINFLRPILGITKLDIETYVESILNDVTLVVPFVIKDVDSRRRYSDGKLFFTVIDIATGKPSPPNDETRKLFFE